MKSHFVISRSRWGGRRKPPLAFTEQGIAMLSSALNSRTAIEVNIAIMRAFVQMRQILISNKDLEIKLNNLEAKYERHDNELKVVFDAIRRIIGLGKKDA